MDPVFVQGLEVKPRFIWANRKHFWGMAVCKVFGHKIEVVNATKSYMAKGAMTGDKWVQVKETTTLDKCSRCPYIPYQNIPFSMKEIEKITETSLEYKDGKSSV